MRLNQKTKGKLSHKIGFGLFSVFFLSAQVFAAPSLSVPSEVGRVETAHEGTNGKTIFLIQEAHVDYNAQKAIAEILKHLIQKENLRLILVEGGWGNVALTYLRSYGTPEGRLQVAERYLKDGKISGEEYLNIVSDLDMSLWGIENPVYYAENMKVFLKLNEKQDVLLAEITKLETLLDALKVKILSPAVQELESKKQAFHKNEIGLMDYIIYLAGKVDQKALNSLPHLNRLLALTTSSKEFDKDKVELEKGTLIQALSKIATKMELDRISILKDRKNPEDEVEFLKTLLAARETHKRKLSSIKVKNLAGYTSALQEIVMGDPKNIFKEVAELEKSVAETASVSEAEKELLALVRSTELLKSLFRLEVGPEEFQKIDADQSFFSAEKWAEYADEKTKEFSVSLPSPDWNLIATWIPEAKAFYESAMKREHALIENAVKKVEESGDTTSALLAGGFHSERLQKAFEDHGYSYFLISPRFTPADPADHSRKYFEILKYKWGQGPDLTSNLSQGG